MDFNVFYITNLLAEYSISNEIFSFAGFLIIGGGAGGAVIAAWVVSGKTMEGARKGLTSFITSPFRAGGRLVGGVAKDVRKGAIESGINTMARNYDPNKTGIMNTLGGVVAGGGLPGSKRSKLRIAALGEKSRSEDIAGARASFISSKVTNGDQLVPALREGRLTKIGLGTKNTTHAAVDIATASGSGAALHALAASTQVDPGNFFETILERENYPKVQALAPGLLKIAEDPQAIAEFRRQRGSDGLAAPGLRGPTVSSGGLNKNSAAYRAMAFKEAEGLAGLRSKALNVDKQTLEMVSDVYTEVETATRANGGVVPAQYAETAKHLETIAKNAQDLIDTPNLSVEITKAPKYAYLESFSKRAPAKPTPPPAPTPTVKVEFPTAPPPKPYTPEEEAEFNRRYM